MTDVDDIAACLETRTFQHTCMDDIASTASPPLRNQNLTASRRDVSVGACSPGSMPRAAA